MFERYTEAARRVFFFAREDARLLGASQIDTEHILLAIIQKYKDLSSRFFLGSPVDLELMRNEIEKRAIQDDRISTNINLPLSSDSKRALAFAAEEADGLKHRHIGIEHFLLGLLRVEDSIAANILNESGVYLADVRE